MMKTVLVNKSFTTFQHQSGVVLVVSLIMLLLLTMLGVTGMQVSGLEEKMAGNSKDQNLAFQAAEAALRDAENDILNSGRVSGLTDMDNQCTDGLCYTGATIPHIETNVGYVGNAVQYGTYTAAPNLMNIPALQQPRYLIVGMKLWPPGAVNWKYMYKITAIAQGGQATTSSILQEVYAP